MKKFITFLFVGGSSALIDVGTLYFFSKILLDDTLSISISFFLGLVFNYICHTYITFNSSASGSNLIKYLIVVLINYLSTLLLIYVMQLAGVDIVIAKIITLPIIAVTTFILSNKWVYK